jgi:hypothetical protein
MHNNLQLPNSAPRAAYAGADPAGERKKSMMEGAVAVAFLVPCFIGLFQLIFGYQGALMAFAFSVTVLVPVFVVVLLVAYTLYTYHRLARAVRAGVRYAVAVPYDSSDNTPSAGYLTAVRNVVTFGAPGGGRSPVVRGLEASQVQINITMGDSGPLEVAVYIDRFSLDLMFKTIEWIEKPAASARFEHDAARNLTKR